MRPLFLSPPSIHINFMWRRTTCSFLRPFQIRIISKQALNMDASVSQRLSNLSKRQLLDALNAVTGNTKCTEHANSALKEFLDALPVVRGSSRPTVDGTEKSGKEAGKDEPQEAPGAFSLSKYRTRQIAMQVQYDGSAYLGFASQDLEETVENHLFNALLKLKLIEDRKTCQYSRCGRTDKGVSALGQVISVNVRSALPRDLPEEALVVLRNPTGKYEITEPAVVNSDNSVGNSAAEQADNSGKEPPRKKSKKNAASDTPAGPKTKIITEMDYVTMLNRTLPDDIRILGWCEVTEEFSARFSASDRKYRYFFPRKTLNIAAMQQAATYLLGNHDFRNLCKMDIANVTNFRRDIYSAEIQKFEPNRYEDLYSIVHGTGSGDNNSTSTTDLVDGPDTMYMLEIKGIAFLWHMVRCIMAVLFMVGEGLEQPEVVKRLLDIEHCIGKPPYTLANEFPLVLHECGFDNLRIPRQPRHLWQLTAHYERILEGHLVSAARVRNSLELVKKSVVGKEEVAEFVEVLVEKETFSAKRAGYQNATFQQRAGLPITAATSAATTAAVTSASTNTSSSNNGTEEVVVWKDVLERVKSDWNLQPIEKYVPHVPLMQRRQEDSYEVKVALLAGGKKERLERHVELSATAATTGATPLFFQKMRQQGSL